MVRVRTGAPYMTKNLPLLLLLLIPGIAEAQRAPSDTALVAATVATDLAEHQGALVVSVEGMGEQIANALGTDAVLAPPQQECPWGPDTGAESGSRITAHLVKMGAREARVHIEIMCHFDNALGGYGAVIRYDLEKTEGDWTIASKKVLIES